jgi:hypothetical protein
VKLLSCAILVGLATPKAMAQTTSASKASWDSFHAELVKMRQSGTAALEHERTRSKSNLCEKVEAEGGKAIVDCLVAEAGTTEQNYIAYVRAIGGLLRLGTPDDANQKTPKSLPFDAAEEDWQRYREQSCRSVSTQWIDLQSSISYDDCRLRLTWNHMNELASLYSDLWH